MMPKFKQLIFIDDDRPTNVFHKIIVDESELCEEAIFFDSAMTALDYFKELVKKENFILPDIIFLDINMPMMDGWEFIEEFKKLGISDSRIIVMLSTSLSTMDKEKANDIALIHTFLNKPLEVETLTKLRKESLSIS